MQWVLQRVRWAQEVLGGQRRSMWLGMELSRKLPRKGDVWTELAK